MAGDAGSATLVAPEVRDVSAAAWAIAAPVRVKGLAGLPASGPGPDGGAGALNARGPRFAVSHRPAGSAGT